MRKRATAFSTVLATTLAAMAGAATLVLDPGPGTDYRSLGTTQGSCSHAGHAVTCTLGSVPPMGSVVVNITAVTLHSEGDVTNTACVDTDTCATTVTELP